MRAEPTIDYAKQQQETVRRAFGRQLQRLMLAKGWNQSDLARRAGVGRDAISTYINGRSVPEPLNRQKIADALGVSVEELVADPFLATASGQPGVTVRQAEELGMVYLTIHRAIPMAIAAEIIDRLKSAQAA